MEQVLNLKMSDKNMTDNSNTHAKCNDCGGLRQFTHSWDGERYFFCYWCKCQLRNPGMHGYRCNKRPFKDINEWSQAKKCSCLQLWQYGIYNKN